ncbi:hypothetical protein HanIR_Chr17g0848861 [Helianthus annuus]|nr:hypothetical protein HanIR_Chr17g0848861 [Helianthus annuus]
MKLICPGCHSMPRTISISDFTDGCGAEQGSHPRPIMGEETKRPPKLVHGPLEKLKDRSFKRKDDGCKPMLMRSRGVRRDWSLENLKQVMNTA